MMYQKSYNKEEQKTAFPGSLSGIPGGSAGRAAASGPLGERSSDFLFSLIPGKAPGSPTAVRCSLPSNSARGT